MIRLGLKSVFIGILFFGALFYLLDKEFPKKKTVFNKTMASYNKSKKDSIDILIFGSSHAFSTFNPMIIDSSLGMYTFNFGSEAQTMLVTNYLQEEILNETSPRLIILDVFLGAFRNSDKDKISSFQLNVFDYTEPSFNKYHTLFKLYDFSEYPSAISNTIRNHNKWSEFQFYPDKEKIDLSDDFRGYTTTKKTIDKNSKVKFKDYYKKDYLLNEIDFSNYGLLPEEKNILIEFVQRAKQKNISVIFVSSPFLTALYSDKILKFDASVKLLADSLNINYLNFNTQFKKLDLSFSDFRDAGHVNIIGSNKVTSTLVDFMIKQNYFEIKDQDYLDSYLNKIKPRSIFDIEKVIELERKELLDNIFKNGNNILRPHIFSEELESQDFTFYADSLNWYIAIGYKKQIPNQLLEYSSIGLRGTVFQKDFDMLPLWVQEKNKNSVTWVSKPEKVRYQDKDYLLLTFKKKSEIENWKEFQIYLLNKQKKRIGNKLRLNDVNFTTQNFNNN